MTRRIIIRQSYAVHETQEFVDYNTNLTVQPIEMIGWVFKGGVKNVSNKWVLEFEDNKN